jgi:hypothetical protein
MPERDSEFDLDVYKPEDLSDDFLSRDAFAPNAFQPDVAAAEKRKQGAFIVRTSDRIAFRRCRRKWNWSTAMRHNRQPIEHPGPFWLGSGFHFALEDYHGYHRFEHPDDALRAYYRATLKTSLQLPPDTLELLDLGCGMLSYYESWLERRDPFETLYENGEPQVEVSVLIEIPKDHLLEIGTPIKWLDQYSEILYSATFDRVIIDSHKRLWLTEYKTAKQFAWFHFETDAQISAYTWLMYHRYPGYNIAGCVYQQHKKQVPKAPEFLASTKMFSVSTRQKTTYPLYRNALQNLYGRDAMKWPEPNRKFLDWLATNEQQQSDMLVRRDFIERNEQQRNNEYRKILHELKEMLDPNVALYPNPTRDCSWDCRMNLACVHLDSGSDWEGELQSSTISRSPNEANIDWRPYLEYP